MPFKPLKTDLDSFAWHEVVHAYHLACFEGRSA